MHGSGYLLGHGQLTTDYTSEENIPFPQQPLAANHSLESAGASGAPLPSLLGCGKTQSFARSKMFPGLDGEVMWVPL